MTQWFTLTPLGIYIGTIFISMLPLFELRGGIPFGIANGMHPWTALAISVLGNMLPVPFIILFIKKIFVLIRKYMPRLNTFIDKIERKAHLKSASVLKYRALGLFIFVAIPLPGTGAWTGALIAALLDMRMREAIPPIFLGVITAGIIMTVLSHGVSLLF